MEKTPSEGDKFLLCFINSRTDTEGNKLTTSNEIKILLKGTLRSFVLLTKSREFWMAKDDLNFRTLGNLLLKNLQSFTLGALSEEATGLIGKTSLTTLGSPNKTGGLGFMTKNLYLLLSSNTDVDCLIALLTCFWYVMVGSLVKMVQLESLMKFFTFSMNEALDKIVTKFCHLLR